MASTAAFEQTRELIASMSLEQLAVLNADVSERLLSSMPLEKLNVIHKHVTKRLVESSSIGKLTTLQDENMARLLLPTKVFNITEILEQILENDDLDFFQLFKIRRVSKAFRDTIAGSAKLKQKLWLLVSADVLPADITSGNDFNNPQLESQLNPLIKHIAANSGFVFLENDYVTKYKDCRRGRPAVPPLPFLEIGFETYFAGVRKVEKSSLPLGQKNQTVATADQRGDVIWSNTRVCTLPIRVRVCFAGRNSEDGIDEECFFACHALEAEEATIGKVYDLAAKARKLWYAMQAK